MSAITNAGLDITINDKIYKFEPLRFEDIEWLELRFKARAIEAGRMSLPSDASRDDKDQMMIPILEQAQKIDLLTALDSLLTMTGVTLMIHRMTRRTHPEVTLDVANQWVRDPAVMDEIRPHILMLMGIKKKSTEEKTTNAPSLNGSQSPAETCSAS